GSLLLICTDGGFFYSTDVGESWTEAIEGEKFNSMIISMQPGAFAVYIVGENAWYTYDLENFDQLNLAGLQGEITSIALNSTHAFLGTSLSGKDGQKSGGIFRKPLDQLITSVESYAANAALDDAEPVYPNPCRTSVHLPYTLHSPCSVKIEVTDNAGRVVVSREEGLKQAGRNLSTLSVDYLQQGIYFCSIYVNGMKTHTKKLVKVN
ncbi:MAG: T9SS type A sorting domain-containing protein, partial [Bacteroidales bacterium]|nr:T9SS type A sorting domain-containing protein [Bacteroidales bacterium]